MTEREEIEQLRGELAAARMCIAFLFTPNPPNGVVGVAEREIRDMEARLSGRFWTVGAGERLATVMWSSPARDRTSRRRSLAGLARVWGTLG